MLMSLPRRAEFGVHHAGHQRLIGSIASSLPSRDCRRLYPKLDRPRLYAHFLCWEVWRALLRSTGATASGYDGDHNAGTVSVRRRGVRRGTIEAGDHDGQVTAAQELRAIYRCRDRDQAAVRFYDWTVTCIDSWPDRDTWRGAVATSEAPPTTQRSDSE